MLICRQPVAFLIKPVTSFCDFFCYVAGILKLYLSGKMIKVFISQADFHCPTAETVLSQSCRYTFCQDIEHNLHILIRLHILRCRCAVSYRFDRGTGIFNLYRRIIIAICKCPEDASHLAKPSGQNLFIRLRQPTDRRDAHAVEFFTCGTSYI